MYLNTNVYQYYSLIVKFSSVLKQSLILFTPRNIHSNNFTKNTKQSIYSTLER